MRAPPEKEGAAAKRPLNTTDDLAADTITPGAVVILRDALARVTRAHEALVDGDTGYVSELLLDLGADLWNLIERAERGPR